MKEENVRGLNGNGLKCIAIAAMLIDHIGAVVIEGGLIREGMTLSLSNIATFSSRPFWWRVDLILRLIGRVAFPIFAFLLVEGFLHTRNIKKYGIRLFLFGLLSEIPFDLAIFQTAFFGGYQNVFFTLFFALLALAAIRKWENDKFWWKSTAAVVLCCLCAEMLHSDYGAFGVAFVVLLYITRQNPFMQCVSGILATIWELTAFLAFIPIGLYNGKNGKTSYKYLFYVFYPLHLLVLYGIWRTLFL